MHFISQESVRIFLSFILSKIKKTQAPKKFGKHRRILTKGIHGGAGVCTYICNNYVAHTPRPSSICLLPTVVLRNPFAVCSLLCVRVIMDMISAFIRPLHEVQVVKAEYNK